MKHVRPFWGRATVIDTPVEEVVRDSGIAVPLTFHGDDGVKRGVVDHVDDDWDDPDRKRATELLRPGTVVFYRGGVRVGDVVVLELNEILAFEVS